MKTIGIVKATKQLWSDYVTKSVKELGLKTTIIAYWCLIWGAIGVVKLFLLVWDLIF